ncbi:MAG: glycosyltransferase family 4 protein [Glaciimonas sp.]|nr:glycosyltransferase family 4 protein [Glaciimonas sp.]
MRVLALPRYSRLGASSRMRFYQYLPSLESAGIDVTVSPLFSDDYVLGLQQGSRRAADVARAYAKRVRTLLGSHSFDLVWIEKEVFPWLPAWAEKALLSSGMPYVLDYDDAVFHYYDRHRNPLVKSFLGGKHPALMQGAAVVVPGNAYLAEFAWGAGAQRVEMVPTVIDLTRYPAPLQKTRSGAAKPPYVGWIGQRATASFLAPCKDFFERLSAAGLGRFAAIGIDAPSLGLPMASIPWAEDTEVASISSFDIGIMPLVDEPFERGKCGYKLIQYMACGLPVVAPPVGVTRQNVDHGGNGFLAETPEQWEQALRTLLADAGLRQRMGQAGRQKVEQQYCIQVTGPKMVALLRAASTPI